MKPFRLHTDTTILILEAVLYQEHNGVEKAISYASQLLSKSESKYLVHKLEFLGLKRAITDQIFMNIYMETLLMYIQTTIP